jgi:hypothetical protein
VRANPHTAAVPPLVAAIALLVATWSVIDNPVANRIAAAGRAYQETETPPETDTPSPEPTLSGTPVVDPAPPPVPLYLPVALQQHDYRAPGPVVAAASGFVHRLSIAEREACGPATHVLRESGDPSSAAVVVAYALRPSDPATVLDLYVGSYVELRGSEEVASDECELSASLLGVDRVRVLDEPGLPTPVPLSTPYR